MWTLYRQAQTFGKNPSEIFGELSPWVAWQFDQAVLMAGTYIQNRLDERTDAHKPRWTFAEIISGQTVIRPTKQSTAARWKAAFGRALG